MEGGFRTSLANTTAGITRLSVQTIAMGNLMLRDAQLGNGEDQWGPSGIPMLSNMAFELSICAQIS